MDERHADIGGGFRALLLFHRSTLIILKVCITGHDVSPIKVRRGIYHAETKPALTYIKLTIKFLTVDLHRADQNLKIVPRYSACAS